MIQRPFVIEQEVAAVKGGPSIRVEMHHEQGGISLTVEHGLFPPEVNVVLAPEIAEQVADAMQTLVNEARSRSYYAIESL